MLGRTHLGTGSLYTILNRLNEQGLLISEWRGMNLDGQASRPYRVYKLTDKGKEAASKALADKFIDRDAVKPREGKRKERGVVAQQHADRRSPPEVEAEDKGCVA
jgi:DNA-binding PadR family transcriptional regulator